MKKIEHVGTVVRIEGDRAVVEFESPEGWSACLRCGCCASFGSETRSIRVVRGDLAEGDTVHVAIPGYLGYLSILLVFVLPVVFFVAGILIGGQLEGGTAAHGMTTVMGGVCGFALAVLVAMVANRKLGRAGNVEVRLVKRTAP